MTTTTMIAIRQDHRQELLARMTLVEQYRAALSEQEQQLRVASYTRDVLRDTWTILLQRGVGRDLPEDMAARAAVAQIVEQDATMLRERCEQSRLLIETLQEGLTFWLASLYGFDPMRDAYEIDLEGWCLRPCSDDDDEDDAQQNGSSLMHDEQRKGEAD